ncbi:MAG: hypothetical protein AB8B47_03465 [Roseobacter sp.]
MFFLARAWFKLLGRNWVEHELHSGLIVAPIRNKRGDLKSIYLQHKPHVYKRIHFADTRGCHLIDNSYNWMMIMDFLASRDPKNLPINYDMDVAADCIIYSIDGEIFSIPISAIRKIDMLCFGACDEQSY